MKFGMRFGDPFGAVEATAQFARVDPAIDNNRRLSYTPVRISGVLYHIIMDGVKKYVVNEAEFEQLLNHLDNNPRAVIEVIETSLQNFDEGLLNVITPPEDVVTLTWAAVSGAVKYKVFRKLAAGSYGSAIHEVPEGQTTYTFTDDPLPDEDYVYKVEAFTAAGGSSFDEEPITITSAPARPSNLVGSWNATTHIFTLSWTASPAIDFDHYAIRHNGGSGSIRLDDAPEDTEATTSWTIDLTGLTGDYEFLVRAVDASGNEEQNLSQLLRISVIVGVHEGLPAVPQNVQFVPISGGKVEMGFVYFPQFEKGFNPPGVAEEARIYYDNGTGTIDYATPLAVVAMSNPTEAVFISFVSGVLADDTYLFAVRVGTAAHPAGIETENEDTYEVTTDSSVPAAITVSSDVF